MIWNTQPHTIAERPSSLHPATTVAGFPEAQEQLGPSEVPSTPEVANAYASLNLQRALPAVDTELWIDDNNEFGSCLRDIPALTYLDEEACWSLHCLWSDTVQANIDIWFSALSPLDPGVLGSQCVHPKGGQIAQRHAVELQMSIVLLAYGDVRISAQTLLEAFRVSRELEAAEFLIINCFNKTESALLTKTADRMTSFFGTQITTLKCSEQLPTSPTIQRAVQAAHANDILILRPGAFVTRGTFATLSHTLHSRTDAAFAGPMLITGKGIVGDAGGIIYSNAKTASYAQASPPTHQNTFMRPVDFLSTACLLVKKPVLVKLLTQVDFGGPAVPLLLASLAKTWDLTMLFQPTAVVHYGANVLGPSRVDLFAPAPSAFAGETFSELADWQQQLPTYCPPGTADSIASRRVLSPKMVWIIDSVHSRTRRQVHMMRALLEAGYDVTILPVVPLEAWQVQEVRAMGVEVLPVRPPRMWQLGAAGICRYDGLIISGLAFAPYKDDIVAACPQTPIIFDLHDLQFVRDARDVLSRREVGAWDFSALTKNTIFFWVDASDPVVKGVQAVRDIELQLIDASHTILVNNAIQSEIIQHYRPKARIHVVSSMFTPSPEYPPCHARHGLLFTAALDARASQQALEWLLSTIVPRVLSALPPEHRDSFVVHVVGGITLTERAAEAMEQLQRVHIHEDLSEEALQVLYNTVKVAAAPFASSAFQSDVLQSMSFHVPVVSTPTAVEGMDMQHGDDIMIGTTFDQFVKGIVEVYTGCELWNKLSRNGAALVGVDYEMAGVQRQLLEALSGAGVGPVPKENRRSCKIGRHWP